MCLYQNSNLFSTFFLPFLLNIIFSIFHIYVTDINVNIIKNMFTSNKITSSVKNVISKFVITNLLIYDVGIGLQYLCKYSNFKDYRTLNCY